MAAMSVATATVGATGSVDTAAGARVRVGGGWVGSAVAPTVAVACGRNAARSNVPETTAHTAPAASNSSTGRPTAPAKSQPLRRRAGPVGGGGKSAGRPNWGGTGGAAPRAAVGGARIMVDGAAWKRSAWRKSAIVT